VSRIAEKGSLTPTDFVPLPDPDQSLFEEWGGDLLGTHAGQESWDGRLQWSRVADHDGQPLFEDRQRNQDD
jgi:hypothetical protein